MYMRMGTKAKAVAKYWVDKFSKGVLERDELESQSYMTFLICQDKWDKGRGAFTTFYSSCLKNKFFSMLKERKKHLQELGRMIDPDMNETKDNPDREDEYTKIYERLKTPEWVTEEAMLWDELIQDVERRLSGLALEVFRVMVNRPVELINLSRTGNVTWTSLGKYFSVSRNVIKKLDYSIRRAVLLALDASPRKIRQILGKKEDW